MRMKQTIAAGAALLAALALAGCSGEPSVKDIKNAMANDPRTRAGFEMMKGLNPNAPASFEDAMAQLVIEKGGCREASGESGFICDVRVGQTLGGQTQFGPWGKGRLFKVNGTWNFEERR